MKAEDETELPGTRRPRKGEGWCGVGPTLMPLRKGVPKPFVDGAGHCSPGRWPIGRRRIPENDIASKLQGIVEKALIEFERGMRAQSPPRDLRHLLMTIATGKAGEIVTYAPEIL